MFEADLHIYERIVHHDKATPAQSNIWYAPAIEQNLLLLNPLYHFQAELKIVAIDSHTWFDLTLPYT